MRERFLRERERFLRSLRERRRPPTTGAAAGFGAFSFLAPKRPARNPVEAGAFVAGAGVGALIY